MAAKTHPYAPLLAALPFPSLLLKGETVLLCNDAALSLLPELSENSSVAELPFAVPAVGASGIVTLSGKAYLLEAKAVNKEILLTLTPQPSSPALLTEERWSVLSEQLRAQLSDLSAAADALAPITDLSENPKAARAAELLNRSLYRLLRLNRHLELCSDTDMNYRPAVFDLAGFCRHFCEETSALVELAGAELDFRSSVQSLLVRGDERLLKLALLSLLSNAIKAAGKGGRLTLSLSRAGAQANLSLSGGGKNVSEDVLSALFRPDFVPPPGGGLGLGIPLVRSIVLLHGGTLLAEKNADGGLTVALSLPPSDGGAPLSVRSPGPDREGGFSTVLVELSDVLPAAAFGSLDTE